jgi:signal transduction histidine kinase
VSAKALQAPARVEISVTDQGSGIPAAKLAQLFQKFSQLHTGGPAQRRGTGLGLAITRAIVEQHKGQVHVVESSPAGTTFRIVLPIVIPE